MSDHISLLKAEYCADVLKTVRSSPEPAAVCLIDALAFERPTGHTSQAVTEAEGLALGAIYSLVIRLEGRRLSAISEELHRLTVAVDHWIATARNTE